MLTDTTPKAFIDSVFLDEMNNYPEVLLQITGVSKDKTDVSTVLDMMFDKVKTSDYTTTADISTDPNANVGDTTYSTLLQECHKGALKLHSLKVIFRKAWALWGEEVAKRILKEEIEGAIYISDLHLFSAPYCYNFSTTWLMYHGLPFIPRIPSAPAQHADTFLQHCAQLVTYASNHQSGACALTGLFVSLDWYFRKDGIVTKKQKQQLLQQFTYTMNQPFRFSAQTPFLNLNLFDRNYLKNVYGDVEYPDGTKMDVESVIALEKLYAEWYTKEMKDKGIVFTFPVLTASILLDKETRLPMDMEFYDWATKTNYSYGTINFFQSDRAGAISSCCRLSNDIDKLQELGYINSFGAGGDGIGSTGVVTVSLPHIYLESKKKGVDVNVLLEQAITDAQKVAYLRNNVVRENMALLPLYKYGFIDINSQYCTVGICGMYEAARAAGVISGPASKEELDNYKTFAANVLSHINELNIKAAEEYNTPFNLEQVPAEGQAVTLATKDRTLGLQNEWVIYSNQWVPLSEPECDIFTRVSLAGSLDQACSGGAILHMTTGTKVSPEVQKRLLLYCARMGVVYCAFNYTLSKCNACHSITPGDISSCPECGATNLEIYTRVVGFVTPVKQWHAVRREEFHRRKRYGDLDSRQKEMTALKESAKKPQE